MAGSTIWAPVGDKGPDGYKGPDGDPGPIGPQGPPGPGMEDFLAYKDSLAAKTDTEGSNLVGLKRYPLASGTTVKEGFANFVAPNIFDYMDIAELVDVESGALLLDHTAAIQKAIDNHTLIHAPSFAFNVGTLNINKQGITLYSESNGNQAYAGGTVFKSINNTLDMLVVSKPNFTLRGLVLQGLSSTVERGEDVTQNGIKFLGDVQKDLDAELINCAIMLFRAGYTANGTNVTSKGVTYSNLKYVMQSSNEGVSGTPWENRGFFFDSACRFHSIGKTGVSESGVNCIASHNVQDVEIKAFADDCLNTFVGFASGLQIVGHNTQRCRGKAIVLDATGHGISAARRTVNIKDFDFHGNETVNLTTASGGLYATGLMRLTVDGVTINGCGGNGIEAGVSGQTLRNITANDVGQSAANTYDGVAASGTNQTLQCINTTQDFQGTVQVNKARYGINIAGASSYVSALNPGLGTSSGPMNVDAATIIRGDLPALTGPATSVTWVNSMPTTGSYQQGSEARLRTRSIVGTAPNQLVLTGWTRLTTGSAHVLLTDWAPMYTKATSP